MDAIEPEVMLRQVAALSDDLRRFGAALHAQLEALLSDWDVKRIERVQLTGNGDSLHAGHATALAFDRFANLSVEALGAQPFVDYAAAGLTRFPQAGSLVIGASASGSSERVVQALQRARQHGALTLAITGTPASAVTQVAERSLVLELPVRERSPGIRTYQATLLGLLATALYLGERRAALSKGEVEGLRSELSGVADAIDRSLAQASAANFYQRVAERVAAAPAIAVLGTGPSYGTASYFAAKLVEGAGLFAVGQDVEEWWHVERFARPTDMPLFLIAPPGRSRARAGQFVARAVALGRTVIVVAQSGDAELGQGAFASLGLAGPIREELSPLLYHLPASPIASRAAVILGRKPFQSEAR